MPRRVSLPGASELFRPTRTEEPARPVQRDQPAEARSPDAEPPRDQPVRSDRDGARADEGNRTESGRARRAAEDGVAGRAVRGSGRVRHEEKITVYVSSEELLALEQARLTLRAKHGMAVDRGRIVREAIAAALAGLEQHGEQSDLIRRLSQ
ncbi:hypothetical protein [Microlunatus parietis]|uniref:Ribbon-helix-helix protein, copG family n=1 Tax=Microlunatus parietis TaxID=682979 RepID=A0A7Y9I3M7_9ACTN|nr:hypothetical protein [Microlunatus parietis]NYE69609.1 hypothetical protein [Microlunatus parietis]